MHELPSHMHACVVPHYCQQLPEYSIRAACQVADVRLCMNALVFAYA